MKNYRITVNGTAYDVAVEEVGAGAAPAAAPVAAAPAADQNQPQPQPQPQQQQTQQPPTVLRRLGSEATVKDDVDEEDRVRNLFGM